MDPKYLDLVNCDISHLAHVSPGRTVSGNRRTYQATWGPSIPEIAENHICVANLRGEWLLLPQSDDRVAPVLQERLTVAQ